MNSTLKFFCTFLRVNLPGCDYSSGAGANLEFPDFDLRPQNYLDYAEEALSNPTDANRINCIGHLKRAIECECETLLIVLNLHKKAKELNFPQKLQFVDNLQLMPSRSLAELNRIRNKVEHEYSTPNDKDLTIYFDLIAGFVAAIDGALFMLATSAEAEWLTDIDDTQRPYFNSNYDIEKATVKFRFSDGSNHYQYERDSTDWNEFCKALGLKFILIRAQALISPSHAINHLPE